MVDIPSLSSHNQQRACQLEQCKFWLASEGKLGQFERRSLLRRRALASKNKASGTAKLTSAADFLQGLMLTVMREVCV